MMLEDIFHIINTTTTAMCDQVYVESKNNLQLNRLDDAEESLEQMTKVLRHK